MKMYERMQNKNNPPEINDIKEFIGTKSYEHLEALENLLKSRYYIHRELRFPFGSAYGWGFKYSHKTKHLLYVFFENGAVTATIQIGDKEVPKIDEQYHLFSEKAKLLWENRYPCGKNGGWIHYRILADDELNDVMRFIEIRKKPS